jgi:hypothetical protein
MITLIIVNLTIFAVGVWLLLEDFNNDSISNNGFGLRMIYFLFTMGICITFSMGLYKAVEEINRLEKQNCFPYEKVDEPLYRLKR